MYWQNVYKNNKIVVCFIYLSNINYNQHLTDVLVTLCKVEKAEGNLLPAASYERAALSLSRYKKKTRKRVSST